MKKHETFQDLLARVNELNNFTEMFPTVSQFIHGHFDSFRRNNATAIKNMREAMEKVYERNVMKDDKGWVINDKTGEPEFLSAAHAADFEKAKSLIMKTPVIIII